MTWSDVAATTTEIMICCSLKILEVLAECSHSWKN
jgi:hypothetical protein